MFPLKMAQGLHLHSLKWEKLMNKVDFELSIEESLEMNVDESMAKGL